MRDMDRVAYFRFLVNLQEKVDEAEREVGMAEDEQWPNYTALRDAAWALREELTKTIVLGDERFGEAAIDDFRLRWKISRNTWWPESVTDTYH